MKQTKKQRETWAAYVAAMTTAEEAALTFADALERYLRAGSSPFHHFDEACRCADAYRYAATQAAEYHFGTVAIYGSGHVVNCDANELLSIVRELRGSSIPVTVRGNGRTLAGYRYADDGIAGFYRVEVRSMRRFGKPRRDAAITGTWAEVDARGFREAAA